MDIVIKPYSALPCATKVFKINGIEAEIEDFGSMEDRRPDMAEPFSCACMCFTSNNDKEARRRAMEKYNITYDEFEIVQNELESVMYVGSCGWCV